MNLVNQILYPLITLFILLSILGYGLIFDSIFKSKIKILNLKNIVFIKGLIFSGSICILVNIFFPISNNISICIILFGIGIYFYYFLRDIDKKKEYFFLIYVIIFSFIYSFYAGVNDDFDYHIKIIDNFKNSNLFSINHESRISYNPHWLFLNSIFTLSYLSSSLFAVSSILYSILIYDLYRIFHKSFRKEFIYTGIISFLILVFFLSVLNKYKEIGTDVPGVIISFYIFIILVINIFDKKQEIKQEDFFTIILFSSFIFIIKITNTLIIFYLFLSLFYIHFSKIKIRFFLISIIIPSLWFSQNYIISGCLIWPIEFTCFKNNELAQIETNAIEAFAKGDINISTNILNSYDWINIWIKNHSTKMIETYLLYFLLMTIPIFYTYFLVVTKSINLQKNAFSIFKEINFLFLFLITILTNLIWFFNAPAYRFGIFYNLTLLILLLLPFWKIIFDINFEYLKKFCKFILVFSLLFFLFENTKKIFWYFERYDSWPPVENMRIIDRKKY